MKKLILIITSLLLAGCAKPVPYCNITWTCESGYCAAEEGGWSGTSQFTGSDDESQCIVWGTAFRYAGGRTSDCSCYND